MKSRIVDEDKEHEKKSFPRLMVHDKFENIVLFTSESTGTLVYQGTLPTDLGETSDKWEWESYTDFTGTIELSND